MTTKRRRTKPIPTRPLPDWANAFKRLRERTAYGQVALGAALKPARSGNWVSLVEAGLLDPPLSLAVCLAETLGAHLNIADSETTLVQAITNDDVLTADEKADFLESYERRRKRRQRLEAAASGS